MGTTRKTKSESSATLRLVDNVISGAIAPGANACAIYNRYSTDLQDPRSLDDQETQNRQIAKRRHLSVHGVYNDAEMTSRTLHGRVAYWRMMDDAKAGKFRTIIVESVDRLSREGESLFGMYKRLKFLGVEIVESASDKVITTTDIAIRALVGEIFMKDLSDKVRRGMTGRVKSGLVMWKPPYGYKFKDGEKKLEIVDDQAAIIVRVFREYISGISPRASAARLRDEGVPSPSGRPWTHEAIIGGMSKALGGRRSGIIGNRTYLGQLHWGVGRYEMNPDTGKRYAKAPEAEPIVIDAPELRIVSDDLWQAAHGRADARAVKNNIVGLKDRRVRQPISRNSRPLSDLVHCGTCGARMILAFGKGEAGRLRCSAAHKGFGCSHGKSYDTKMIQAAVRDYLHDKFQNAEVIKTAMKAFTDGWNADAASSRKRLGQTQRRLTEIEAQLMKIGNAYAKGLMEDEDLKRLAEPLTTERAHLRELEVSAQSDIKAVDLHPQAFAYCQTFIGGLPADLDDMSLDVRMAFRNIVGRVVVKETARRAAYNVEVELFSEALTGAINLAPAKISNKEMLLEQGLTKYDNGDQRSPAPTLSYQRKLVSLGPWRQSMAA